jgi:O-antigen/teichoic acid export membrane protein
MTRNMAWAFLGNTVYAAGQWAVFILLVKILRPEQAGAFAYATAVTGPIFVFANLRLRNLLATGVESPGGFSDYLNARLLTTAAAVTMSIAIGALSSHVGSFAVLVIMAAGRGCDALSEICHGLFQHELDMRAAAIGLSINGLASVGLVAVVLAVSPSLELATAASAAGSFLALVVWDRPKAARLRTVAVQRDGPRPGIHWIQSVRRLLTMALPIGLSSAIGSVQANVPRYVIASYLGSAMLARFAAISYIPMVGHLVVNATSQAALPLLAREVRHAQAQYRRRLAGLVASTIALGSLTLLAALVFGRPALVIIYGTEYGDSIGVLLWLLLATMVMFTSVFLGTGTTARHRFSAQCAISAIALVVVAASTAPLVDAYGLTGAAWALLAGSLIELSAYAVLTARDLRGAATAAPIALAGALAGGVRR